MTLDLRNQRFGRLTALYPEYSIPKKGVFWKCRCDCGNENVIRSSRLVNGSTISCGCAKGKHKHSGNGKDRKPSPTYLSWKNMMARCTQPSNPAFAHYQKRGITVCERWRSFENFLADMGERQEGTTLDRIDNDKGYQPTNCRWASKRVQGNNRITNIRFTYRGHEYTLAELARETGVSKETLRCRLVRPGGWSVEAAVETPTIPRELRWASRRRA